MRAWLIILAAGVVVAAALGLYRFEIHVRQLDHELASLNRSIQRSQQAVQVLQAEWAFLTQPERLQSLALKHLDLVPTLPVQIGAITAIPEKGPVLVQDLIAKPAFSKTGALLLSKAEAKR